MKEIIFFALILIGAHQAFSQQNNDKFYTISEKIESLLRCKAKNTIQLRALLYASKEAYVLMNTTKALYGGIDFTE
ncbi:MAG: hypothetical protein QNK85_03090 [Crocinitomicaceae bacterium]